MMITSEEDNALPMWHSSYADLCCGCAIGINHKRLKSQTNENTQLFNNVTRSLYVDTLYQDIKVAPSIPISWIHTFLFPLTPLIKSENYRHEAEYRLICLIDNTDPRNGTIFKGNGKTYIETEPLLI